MLALLISVLLGDPVTSVIGLLIPVSGVIVYFIFFNKKKPVTAHSTTSP
jgi:hypothetical protein